MAAGYARAEVANAYGARLAFPAQELVRIESRERPRNWASIWRSRGGRLYRGRMVALKEDPVWTRISRFGQPWPPFDFNSGMGVEDVSHDEAVELGVIREDYQPPEKSPLKAFNEGLSAEMKVGDGSRLVGQVSISSPALAHKLARNPPEIRPKGGRRYLAIPVNPVAAGWDGRPRDFPGGLRFAFSKTPDGNWLASLVAAGNYKRKDGRLAMTGRGGKDGANEVVYRLVHKVRTRHDSHAMPTQESQLNAATAAVRMAVLKILAKRDASASM